MSFFTELKRRNVFRVGAAYLVAAWLVIQLVETIFPAFGFGDSAVRLAVIVLAIGFVPVLILAWAFEITPEGVKRDEEVDRSRSISADTGRKLNRAVVVLLVVAVGYLKARRLHPWPRCFTRKLRRTCIADQLLPPPTFNSLRVRQTF